MANDGGESTISGFAHVVCALTATHSHIMDIPNSRAVHRSNANHTDGLNSSIPVRWLLDATKLS